MHLDGLTDDCSQLDGLAERRALRIGLLGGDDLPHELRFREQVVGERATLLLLSLECLPELEIVRRQEPPFGSSAKRVLICAWRSAKSTFAFKRPSTRLLRASRASSSVVNVRLPQMLLARDMQARLAHAGRLGAVGIGGRVGVVQMDE
jgi:hypothetical protein